ncbi:ABC transporter ATP-binding protein [Abyssibacter profundi]|uniref:ABC-type dipeptide transporter n=1 Tax=Abyssibacter profundi TaxID=2182787 RepID=A0A363UQK7_9GAMM|nr:ABC transporter ATP-binding protein [Abyssibacter profundi]MBV59899.1 peptide ABC transporter ATP-binding protein [Nevskiales bacterium]PWN57726.1 peptide ABC transporter ATP-binding protein [Abyssibacter profundi]
MALLEVDNLQVEFSTERGIARAIDGVSFSVNAGETLGIVGESGCGKSVTSLSIMGLIPRPPGEIVGGEIRFNGQDLTQLSDKAYRKLRGSEISMIFQEPMTALNPVFTIGNQIIDVLRRHKGLTRKQARARAIEMLAEVGIPAPDKRVDEYPHQLSGGMRQRVMIAMALSCDPKLLIADEPTTALDVTIQAQVLELIKKLAADHGTAVILITHDLGVVAETCDRAAVMYCGKIIEQGPVGPLFNQPRHPYTAGLLASVPRIRPDRLQRLPTIPGIVPDLLDLPQGCRFRDRCSQALERCGSFDPELDDSPDTATSAACFNPNPVTSA